MMQENEIVRMLTHSHDRFLLIDDEVYHIGASIKDLGKRWFAIMKMQATKADEIIGRASIDLQGQVEGLKK